VPVDLKQDHSHCASMRFTTMGHGTSACDRYLVFLDNIWGACLAMAGTGSRRPILGIREPLSSAFIRGIQAQQGQTNPRDLDAEMITRLPVATASDNR
jgi:hypothetical protein